MEKEIETLGDALKETNEEAKSLARTLFGLSEAFSLRNVLKDVIDTEKAFHRLAINAGKGEAGFRNLTKQAVELQKGLSATRKEAVELTSAFAEKQYIGNLDIASKAAYSFARATGQSIRSVAGLSTELNRAVGLSDKAIASSYANILKIQQVNGISREGMEELSSSIVGSATNMRAFGKSDEAIKSMITSTAKLVSSMEKVGISARQATEWIDRLTDPDKLEDNIALYSQLGISISDALSGEDITGQMQTGFKELGNKLKEMGPIAGSAYAKALGVSYKDAIKAANLEEVTQEIATPEEQSLEVLKELTENTKAFTEKLSDFGNKILGFLYGLPKLILGVFTVAMPFLTLLKTKIISGIKDIFFMFKAKWKGDIETMFDLYDEKKQKLEAQLKNMGDPDKLTGRSAKKYNKLNKRIRSIDDKGTGLGNYVPLKDRAMSAVGKSIKKIPGLKGITSILGKIGGGIGALGTTLLSIAGPLLAVLGPILVVMLLLSPFIKKAAQWARQYLSEPIKNFKENWAPKLNKISGVILKGFGFITWSLGHLLSILTFGKSEFAKDLIQAGKDMMSGEAMKNSVSDGVSKGMEESKKFQITSDNKGNVYSINGNINQSSQTSKEIETGNSKKTEKNNDKSKTNDTNSELIKDNHILLKKLVDSLTKGSIQIKIIDSNGSSTSGELFAGA